MIKADFKGVPRQNFRRVIGRDGRKRYKVQYNINIRFDSAIMSFLSEIDGKEMGEVEAIYE